MGLYYSNFVWKTQGEKKSRIVVSKGKNPISVSFEKWMADGQVIDHNVYFTEELEQER